MPTLARCRSCGLVCACWGDPPYCIAPACQAASAHYHRMRGLIAQWERAIAHTRHSREAA